MRRFIFRLPRFAGKRRVGQYLLGGGRYPCEAILDIGATVVKDRVLLGGSGARRFQMAAGRRCLSGHTAGPPVKVIGAIRAPRVIWATPITLNVRFAAQSACHQAKVELLDHLVLLFSSKDRSRGGQFW